MPPPCEAGQPNETRPDKEQRGWFWHPVADADILVVRRCRDAAGPIIKPVASFRAAFSCTERRYTAGKEVARGYVCRRADVCQSGSFASTNLNVGVEDHPRASPRGNARDVTGRVGEADPVASPSAWIRERNSPCDHRFGQHISQRERRA